MRKPEGQGPEDIEGEVDVFAVTWGGVRNGHEITLPAEVVIDLKLETICALQPSGKEWPFKAGSSAKA